MFVSGESLPRADRSGVQTFAEKLRHVGFSEGVGSSIRSHNGTCHLHAHCCPFVVPLRLRIPDAPPLQPSLQSRPPDFDDLGREEGQGILHLTCLDITEHILLVSEN